MVDIVKVEPSYQELLEREHEAVEGYIAAVDASVYLHSTGEADIKLSQMVSRKIQDAREAMFAAHNATSLHRHTSGQLS